MSENTLIERAANPATGEQELAELWEWACDSDTIVREAVFRNLITNQSTPRDLLFALVQTLLPHHDDLAMSFLNHDNADARLWEYVLRKPGYSMPVKRVAYRLWKNAV